MLERRWKIPGEVAVMVRIGLATSGCHEDGYIAEGRVERLLEAWRKGGIASNGSAQDAITIRAVGDKGVVDGGLSDAFDRWRREKDLSRPITSFEVTKARVDTWSQPPTAHVTVIIDGKFSRMSVTRGSPIRWAD